MAGRAAKTVANWSDVPDEIWGSILSKLKGKDRLRSKKVCRRWRKVVENLPPSSLPWLVLAPKRDGFYFYNHEPSFYHMKNIPQELSHDNGVCLGSCYGWLLYLNNQLEFMLLNPFSWNRIPLPPLKSFPDLVKVEVKVEGSTTEYEIVSGTGWTSWFGHVRGFAGSMRSKVVLSSRRPNCEEGKTIGVVVIYTLEDCSMENLLYDNLAFCSTAAVAQDSKWTKLNENECFLDITSHEQEFYALRQDFSVQVWDFPNASFPTIRTVIQCDASSVPPRIADDPRCFLSLIKECWIVKKGHDILLLVLSKVSRHFKKRGVILVYKLDSDGRWTEVESIGNHALLLGLNQAALVPGNANPEDFDHKGSVYFINKVSHLDKRGDNFYTSVFKLGGKQFENLKVDSVRYPHDLGPRPDPVFYWVEAPF